MADAVEPFVVARTILLGIEDDTGPSPIWPCTGPVGLSQLSTSSIWGKNVR
jgi:hypothetical protein